MGKIRIGLIGCGNIAAGHARRLLTIPQAQLVALCDIDQQAFTRLYERVPGLERLPEFADYQHMLATIALDAVQVLTPHTLHFEHVMAALDNDLHVLVEKPMVCNTKDAKAVVATQKKKNKVVLVSYQRHYQDAFIFIRDLLSDPRMGKIQFVSALQGQNWLLNTAGQWRQEPQLSGGGQLNDSGSHLLDIILWTTGLQVETVHAFSENFHTLVDINTSLSAKCTNGAQLSLAVVGHSSQWCEDITFWTENGVIFYRDGVVRAHLRDQEKVLTPEMQATDDSPDHNFVAAILGKEAVQSRPEDALKVIQLTEAAWRSSATKKTVTVDLV